MIRFMQYALVTAAFAIAGPPVVALAVVLIIGGAY